MRASHPLNEGKSIPVRGPGVSWGSKVWKVLEESGGWWVREGILDGASGDLKRPRRMGRSLCWKLPMSTLLDTPRSQRVDFLWPSSPGLLWVEGLRGSAGTWLPCLSPGTSGHLRCRLPPSMSCVRWAPGRPGCSVTCRAGWWWGASICPWGQNPGAHLCKTGSSWIQRCGQRFWNRKGVPGCMHLGALVCVHGCRCSRCREPPWSGSGLATFFHAPTLLFNRLTESWEEGMGLEAQGTRLNGQHHLWAWWGLVSQQVLVGQTWLAGIRGLRVWQPLLILILRGPSPLNIELWNVCQIKSLRILPWFPSALREKPKVLRMMKMTLVLPSKWSHKDKIHPPALHNWKTGKNIQNHE